MYPFTIPEFFLCTSLMCLASLSFLIAMSLMFTAVSLISILIANSLCSAMISRIFSVVYLMCIPKKCGSSHFKHPKVYELLL